MDYDKNTYTACDRLLNRDETARYLGTTLRSVDRLVSNRVLIPVRIPGLHRTLFDKANLERLIDSAKSNELESAS